MTKRQKTKAQKMAAIRADKEARGICRQCPNPVAVHPKTGAPRRSCQFHLDADAARNLQNRKS